MHEQHFASPPDYNLLIVQDPDGWFNELRAAIHHALAPFAPAVN